MFLRHIKPKLETFGERKKKKKKKEYEVLYCCEQYLKNCDFKMCFRVQKRIENYVYYY